MAASSSGCSGGGGAASADAGGDAVAGRSGWDPAAPGTTERRSILLEQVRNRLFQNAHAVAVNDAHALYLRQGGGVEEFVHLLARSLGAMSGDIDLAIRAVEAGPLAETDPGPARGGARGW